MSRTPSLRDRYDFDLADLRARLGEGWRRFVWDEPPGRPLLVQAVARHLRAWDVAVAAFDDDLMEMRAHALTYRTLLSLVPFLAVAFSLFKAFGGLEAGQRALQRIIIDNLAPGSAAAAMEYVQTFVDRISAGAIGGVGVVLLFVTAVSLLASIEASFNALWNVARPRSFLSRFITYWAVITVGPVLLSISLSLTSAAQAHGAMARLDAAVPGIVELAFGVLPWGMSVLALSLLYRIVPNTGVSSTAAVGGGLVAGSLWEAGKHAFTWASGRLFEYGPVYGSLGILPVFLLWLQTGWIIILLGCKVSYALQYSRVLREQRVQVEVGPAGRERLGLRCMLALARAHRLGLPPPTVAELVGGTTSALKAGKLVLDRLERGGLVHAIPDVNEEEDEGYVPARDPATTTVGQVLDVLRQEDVLEPADDEADRLARSLADRIAEASAAVRRTTLAELAAG